jgi:hypothetical protein
MLTRASGLLLALVLLGGCMAPSWTITPLRGQTAGEQSVDRDRCARHARWFPTREGGTHATIGVDPVAYQGCLEAKGYRVQ